MNQWSTSPVSLLSHDYCALLVLHFCCFDNRYLAATHLIPRARGAEGSRAVGLFLSVPPAPFSAKSHCCPSNRPTRAVALDCWMDLQLSDQIWAHSLAPKRCGEAGEAARASGHRFPLRNAGATVHVAS